MHFFYAEVELVWIPQNHGETSHAEVVFFHLVRYAGYIERSIASRARNVDTLFFMIG
jgi:hypothetical protein